MRNTLHSNADVTLGLSQNAAAKSGLGKSGLPVRLQAALIAGAAAALGTSGVYAATISAPTNTPATGSTYYYETVNTIGPSTTSPPLGADGYYMWTGTASNTTVVESSGPSYAVVAPVLTHSFPSNNTNLTIAGTTYKTAEEYNGSTTFIPYMTITLTTNIPTEFQLGFLMDMVTGTGDATQLSVDITNNTGSPQITGAVTTKNTSGSNNFYTLDVTGAQPNDVITVEGKCIGGTNGSLGGVTFDTLIAAPEPGSLCFLGLGALGLLTRRRARG